MASRICLVLLLLVASRVSAQDTTRALCVDDLFNIARVGSPVVSPEGEWVAYTVTSTSLADEKSETRVWMAPFEEGEAIPMTAAGSSAGSPAWSPDGRYLSFTASRGEDAKTQVWVLDRRGGEAQALTDVKQGISSYAWSPDGSRLLLTITDPEPEDSTWKETKRPWVVDRLQFKRDYTHYLTGDRHTHLYVLDVATRKLTQITSGRWDEGQAVWSPDGTRVAFVSNRTDDPDSNSNSDIWVVSASNTDEGGSLAQVTSNPGSDSSPAWSPDGKTIAFVTSIEPERIWYATSHLATAPADGSGPARLLTQSLDRNVSGPTWSQEGNSIWFRLEDSAENHLARIDPDGSNLRRVVSGPLSVGSFDATSPSGRLALIISRTDLPGEVFNLERGTVRQLTHVNEGFLTGIQLGEVRNVEFPSADGTTIEGFVHFPPGFVEGVRYPTLLRIHGGPVSQYSHRFNFEAHLFAAKGYLVVTTNPRGSSGYGQAFSEAIWADWGEKDSEDVIAGVDFAIEQGWGDPDRLGIGGWSYGGILTNHVITRTDRFKGAISGASEVLYVANYGHDHYQLQWELELGLPWENRAAWERISPFNKVERIATPTLLMGGEKDWNVPIQNSEQLYQALRRRGVPTQLVVYPDQGHGLRPPSYQKHRLEQYLAWYGKWVKRETDTP